MLFLQHITAKYTALTLENRACSLLHLYSLCSGLPFQPVNVGAKALVLLHHINNLPYDIQGRVAVLFHLMSVSISLVVLTFRSRPLNKTVSCCHHLEIQTLQNHLRIFVWLGKFIPIQTFSVSIASFDQCPNNKKCH